MINFKMSFCKIVLKLSPKLLIPFTFNKNVEIIPVS